MFGRFLQNDRTRVKYLNDFAQEDEASDMDWGIYTSSEIVVEVGQENVRVWCHVDSSTRKERYR